MNNDLELEAVEVLPESNEVEVSNIAEEAIEESNRNENINSNENENIQLVEAENASTAAIISPVPDFVTVYCTATLDNCPDGVLSQEYGDSIRRFLGSEPHLQQNIVSADLQHSSSRSFRGNKYTHAVFVTLMVRTERLWESAATYVRKHLGLSNSWTRSNGTVVKLSKIHQK